MVSKNLGSPKMFNIRKSPFIIFIVLSLGTWCATAFAQITISDTTLPDFNAAEQAAIQRAVAYWNDVITTKSSSLPSGTLNVTFNTDVTFANGSGAGGFSYSYTPSPITITSGAGEVTVSAGTSWSTQPNTQIANGSRNLEKLIVHELGHVLNIMTFGLDVDSTTGNTVTINKSEPIVQDWDSKSQPYWSNFVYDKDGNKLMDKPDGTILTINSVGPFTYRGTNAMKVWGDDVATALPVYSADGEYGSVLAHPITPFGTMNPYYNDYTRPFFSEVELAIMQDLGHTINIKNFFGRSFYQTHEEIDVNDTIATLNGMYGVGLHLVAANNTINLNTDITTTGYAGAGIRIENVGNTVTIASGKTVTASGESGVGVLVTHGAGAVSTSTSTAYSGSGATLINEGMINATGTDGCGVWFNAKTEKFDNYGKIDAGTNDAIYIGSGVQVGAINFYDGTHIIGNVVTDSNYATAFKVLGTTVIDGNVYIPNKTLQVMNGGTLAPHTGTADTFATMDITGNLTMESGSTLSIEIGRDSNGEFDSDKIAVTGIVTIQPDARLNVEFVDENDKCEDGNAFHVISVTGSPFNQIVGEFDMDTWGTSFIQEKRFNGYWISWMSTTPEFANAISGFASPNAYNAAAAMDTVRSGSLYKALAGMNKTDPQALASAFAQLHGEVFVANKEAASQLQRRFQSYLPGARNRLWNELNGIYLGQSPCEPCGTSEKTWNHWANITGDWLGRGNINQYSGFDIRSAGVIIGADRKLSSNAFVGWAFGYENASQTFRSINSRNQTDMFRMALYGGVRRGGIYADGYASYARNWHKTQRDINFAGFSETARSFYNDDLFSTGFELGRKMQCFSPSVGLHYIHIGTPSVTESGGSASLYINGCRYQSLRMPVGAKWSQNYRYRNVVLTPEARAFYVREFANDSASVRTSFNAVRGATFLATSGVQGRNSGRFGLGVGAQLSDRLNFRVDYDYEVYERAVVSELSATLGVKW